MADKYIWKVTNNDNMAAGSEWTPNNMTITKQKFSVFKCTLYRLITYFPNEFFPISEKKNEKKAINFGISQHYEPSDTFFFTYSKTWKITIETNWKR